MGSDMGSTSKPLKSVFFFFFFLSYTDKKKKKVFLSYKLKVRGKHEKSLKTKLNI